MHVCPVCKGAKKNTYAVHAEGVTKNVELSCGVCFGTGQLSDAGLQAHKALQAMWCRCGNPSGNASFHDDTPTRKHHWTCDDCGKITQVG